MSLIGLIDNIPLYTTIEEAGIWGSQYGLEVVTSLATGDVEPGTTITTGYHTHYIQGSQGFMAGNNHSEIMEAMQNGIQNFLSPQQLSQGNFVITTEERQAYDSLVIAQDEEVVAAPQVVVEQLDMTIMPTITQPQQVSDSSDESNNTTTTTTTTYTSGGGGGGY